MTSREGPRAPASVHDLRLAPAAACAWAAAWAAPHLPVVLGLGAAGVVAFAGLVVALAGRARRGPALSRTARAVLVAALACAAAGSASAALRVVAIRSGPVPELARAHAGATVRAVVTGDPHVHAGGVRRSRRTEPLVVVPARAERVTAHGRTVAVRTPILVLASGSGWRHLLPSQRVVLWGTLAPSRPGELLASVVRTRGPPDEVGAPSAVQEVAGRLRAGLRTAVDGLGPAERGLVPGLVVGDTSRLPPDVEQDFKTSGLTHLTAVSGANVAIVVAVVLALARWAGVRGRWLPALALGGVGGFVVLCRPEPSVVRATAMGVVSLVALASGRRHSGLPALCAAVVVLVLAAPGLALSLGFALSVCATGGILLLGRAWGEAVARVLPRPVAEPLAVTAAAQVACLPLLVAYTARVSLVAVPANLLVAPAVAPATILGLAAAVSAPVLPPLATLVGDISGLPAWWIVVVAHLCARLPSATVPWWGGAVGGLAAVCAIVLAVPLLVRVPRDPRLAAVGVAVVVGLGTLHGVVSGWPPRGWLFVACDVGQGDGLVLAAGPHTGVVVDAGPDPGPMGRCLDDLGIDTVPLVVLTHFHADHVEGLPGVLRHASVGEVEVSPYREPAGEAARVDRWLRAAGVPESTAVPGERRGVGSLRWTVLGPVRVVPGDSGSAPNNASVVLAVRAGGVRLLLTGDVEPPAQRDLLATGDALAADVLKVPHHGSRYQDPAFLARVHPRLAVASVGAHNDYGHPAPSTLRLLRRGGATVARTDRDGDVAVVGPRSRLHLVLRGGRRSAVQAVGPLCHAAGRACTILASERGARDRSGGPARRPRGPRGGRESAGEPARGRARGRRRRGRAPGGGRGPPAR